MSNIVSAPQNNPLASPLSRKLLGLKVIAACSLSLVIAFYALAWLDEAKLDLPKWIWNILALPFLAAAFGFLYGVAAAGADLVVHFLGDGGLKRLLLGGDRTPDEIAANFESVGYVYALLPAYIAGGIVVLAIALALVVGGVAAVLSLWNNVVDKWPPWAIVITILLILLLQKK